MVVGPLISRSIDAEGKLLGRLVVGEQMEVIAFGANDVLLRRRDADGAAHLAVYEIIEGKTDAR